MLDEETIAYMIDHMNKNPKKPPPPVKNDIDEEEAIQIYNEIIRVFASHNLSYQCATRISLALNDSLLKGAAEIYRIDNS